MFNFQGPALRRSPKAFVDAAEIIGCDVAAVKAVVQVEAAGKGFDAQGRPLALFEPHVFYRNLSGRKLNQAVEVGLAYAKWKPGAYPKDSYPRILRALAIDETAALKATSWGLGQILGENHAMAGFATPQAMVAAFCEGEDAQIAGMARFIVAKKLARFLKALDFRSFARGYNGPRYAENNYHVKLERAHRQHAGAVGFAGTDEGEDFAPVDDADVEYQGNSQPERGGFFRKVRNWMGVGLGYAGAAQLTDWQTALVLLASAFVVVAAGVAFIILFFGAENVRAWVRRQVL